MARNAVKESEPEVDLDEKYDEVTVETAIKSIEAAYQFGLKSIEKHGERSKPNGIIPALAAKKGYRRDAIERVRQFARAFSEDDVQEICDACRNHNFPLGVSLIYRVLPLRDTENCMRLLLRAIRERWAQRRLVAEVRARSRAVTRSGRPRVLPKSPTEARQAIVFRIKPVRCWLEDVKSCLVKKHDASLLGKISKAVSALDALVKAASVRRQRQKSM